MNVRNRSMTYLLSCLLALVGLAGTGSLWAVTIPNPTIGTTEPALTNPIAPGTVLAIQGDNFGYAKGSVMFGASKQSAAAIVLWSNQQIRVTVPTGTGTVDLTVVTAKRKSSTATPFIFGSPNTDPGATVGYSNFKVFAASEYGMNVVDKDFSVLGAFLPRSALHAQVVGRDTTGNPHVFTDNEVELRYTSVADPKKSINTSSLFTAKGKAKTNLWGNANKLLSPTPNDGQIIVGGLTMMADGLPSLQAFTWDAGSGLFTAKDIPVFPISDAGKTANFPMLRVTAYDKTNHQQLAYTDVVVPVSNEVNCAACHATGKQAAVSVPFFSKNKELQTRSNILYRHDSVHNTDHLNNMPVRCSKCHLSELSSTGYDNSSNGLPFSFAIHKRHFHKNLFGSTKLFYDEAAPVTGLKTGLPTSKQQFCDQCHPGPVTPLFRGAMSATITCQNCHGTMEAIAGTNPIFANAPESRTRVPWQDEPRCESCHTGDAVDHIAPADAGIDVTKLPAKPGITDGIRLTYAYDPADTAATPRSATNRRFAEETGKLFRQSKGHSGLACTACHGTMHGIWPGKASSNDNVTATQQQGHIGTIGECNKSCHGTNSPTQLAEGGPHGLHVVNDVRWWGSGEGDAGHGTLVALSGTDSCKTCHGPELRGTVLSRAFDKRTFRGEFGTKTVAKGTPIGCYTCHNGPNGDSGN